MTTSTSPAAGAGPLRRRHRLVLSRPVAVLAAAVAVAGLSWGWAAISRPITPARVAAAPVAQAVPVPGGVPVVDDPSAVGGSVDGRLPLADRISFWAARVAAQPDDFLSITQLATAHAERARLTADLSADDQALALIERSLAIVPSYPPTILARASIRFAIHDFTGAAADAETVLAVSPKDATALSIVGDARLELGDPAGARRAYDAVAGIAPGPWLDIRRARLAYATGDPATALALARRASDVARTDDPADAGFYLFALGEFARLTGDGRSARTAYDAALAIRPGDLGALVGLARLQAFDGDREEARATLVRAAAIAPQPETLAILGDLAALDGDTDGAARQYATVRLTRQLSELSGSVYDRQLALFELDHGPASEALLADARQALTVRSDPAGHDTVAWALHRLGRDDEAIVESDAARASGIVDARILYHAGAIAVSRGDVAAGRSLLQQALDLGPALDPLDRQAAEELLAG